MQKLWILLSFAFSLLVSDWVMAQGHPNYCMTRSRGLVFRVLRGEAIDLRAEAFSRCLRSRQTRDHECNDNLCCDNECGNKRPVAPPPPPPYMPQPPNREPARPPAYQPPPPPVPVPVAPPPVQRTYNQILLCEIEGLRSSGPNQEAITNYLIDVCKRRRDLVVCYSNLRCNDELVYKYLRRCELRGNGFMITAFGVEDRQARLVIAQTCRNQPGNPADCDQEPACASVPNRPGMDLATRTEGNRRTTPAMPPPPVVAPPTPQPPAPSVLQPPAPVVVPPRPAAGGDVIITPKTPVYKGTEPQPDIPAGVGPFR